jgi:pilus assembly protein CpaF
MADSANGELQQSDTRTIEYKIQTLIQRVHSTFVDDALDLSCLCDLEGEELLHNIRLKVEQVCDKVCHEEKTLLNRWEREMIVEAVLDETLGFGPLEILLKDPKNSATLIKGPREVYVLREEREHRANVIFRDQEHLTHIIERIASREGNQVTVPFPLQLSEEDCIVIRHSSENLPTLEVFMRRWSP